MNKLEIIELVRRFHKSSARRLHLIPSENTLSSFARLPFVSDLVHRYSFPADGPNYAWPGVDEVAKIESETCQMLRYLLGAQHINLKPLSGISAMAVAVSALSEPSGTLLSISESDGGHGSTRFIAQQLGLSFFDLPFDRANYTIDPNALRDLIAHKSLTGPFLVYLDQFMCLFPHDLTAIRSAIGNEATLCYDASHVLGLIAGGQFQAPLTEGADVLTASTHKTFPGPHKGVLATNNSEFAHRINKHASYWVSHHHPADLASLAITAAEMIDGGQVYAAGVVANARALAAALATHGFSVCGANRGFTQSHQIWVDIAPIMPPEDASRSLMEADILLNAVAIPYLPTGFGLRLGVQEATRRGMTVEDMDEIADIIAAVLIRKNNAVRTSGRTSDLLLRYPSAADSDARDFDISCRDRRI